MEFMNIYIDQGQLSEFVTRILLTDRKNKEETAQKEDDDRLWLAYIHSMTDMSFHDWKDELRKKKEPVVMGMTDKQVEAIKQHARGILKRISS